VLWSTSTAKQGLLSMRLFVPSVPTLFRSNLSSAKYGAHETEKTTISEETSKKQTGGGGEKLDAQHQNKSTDQIDPKKSGPTAGSSNTAQKIEHQIEDVANDAIDYKKK
jgi:hypothetical protein